VSRTPGELVEEVATESTTRDGTYGCRSTSSADDTPESINTVSSSAS